MENGEEGYIGFGDPCKLIEKNSMSKMKKYRANRIIKIGLNIDYTKSNLKYLAFSQLNRVPVKFKQILKTRFKSNQIFQQL